MEYHILHCFPSLFTVDGEDFEGGSFSVFFPRGVTMATLIIPTTANPAVEGTEQFKVMIVDPGTAMTGDPSIAVINITEDSNGGMNLQWEGLSGQWVWC